jgi:hypothetical protein
MLKSFESVHNISFYTFNSYLEGGITAYGRTGAGKSVSLLSIIQSYFDKFHYKIWDLDPGPRAESYFWAIPSQDTKYWEKLKILGAFTEPGPKQYKINFLYPLFDSKTPKRLPKKINEKGEIIVNSIPFTIPFKSLSAEDIKVAIGNISDTADACWKEIVHRLKKTDTLNKVLEDDSIKKIKGFLNSSLYRNFLLPLSRENFIMDSYCEKNINLIEEAKNIETISVLCLDMVPKEFQLFVLNWINRNLADLMDSNKIPKKNICFIREAGRYFKATSDSIMPDEYKIFRSQMSDYIRLSRRGAYYCLEENTEIISNNRNIKIRDLPYRSNVKSYNFDEDIIEDDIATKKYIGEKECYEITLENNEKIITTEEHKFFNVNGKEIEVKKLKKGDVILKW